MHALRRPDVARDADVAGRGRRARTGRNLWIAPFRFGPPLIDDFVNSAAHIIRYVERSIRPDCDAGRAVRGFIRRLYRSRETVGEYLAFFGCMIARKRLENGV